MFGRFKTMSTAPEFLIVGLGNPGQKYEMTRHNSGFLFVELLTQQYHFSVKKLKYHALIGDAVIEGHRVLIMKPQTFMNDSGVAVRECAAFYKLPPERIVVVFDDSSLPVGALRIKRDGSDGGHKGIRSIIEQLGSDKFPRIKIGIGQKPHPDYDMADYVLSAFKKEEIPAVRGVMERGAEALPYILSGEIDTAMCKYN